MRRAALLAALLWSAPALAKPTLEPVDDKGVHLMAPAEWKVLIQPSKKNVTLSSGLASQMFVNWYELFPRIHPTAVLDILITTVNQQLPIGTATDLGREPFAALGDPWAARRGMIMRAEVKALGYAMKLGCVAVIDEPNQRFVAAFVLMPPDVYESDDGLGTLADVTTSFHLDSDPPLPEPGWWFYATTPPELLAAP